MSCKNLRIHGPSGCWEYGQIIGASVKIKSLAIGNFFTHLGGTTGTVENIYFRISLDGKAITCIELKEFPGKVFTLKDLEFTDVNCSPLTPALCGEGKCGEVICGYKV